MNQYKVILHINESTRWKVLLTQVKNLLIDLGQDHVMIEVLANGDAVTEYLPGAAFLAQMDEMSQFGVQFVSCRNSLRSQQMDETAMPAFVTIVNAGISELVKRQLEGYAYIKA